MTRQANTPRRRLLPLTAAVLLGSTLLTGLAGNVVAQERVDLLNVSYDPTREFYREYNQAFAEHWQEEAGQSVNVRSLMVAPAPRHAP
jgi:sulfate/thiosulfate transport system substrate-binding protein